MEQRVMGRRWAVNSSASGTVMIAAGAFWLSFVALADLARRSGIEREQWVWPLLVAGALVSVTANALHAVVAADANIPVVLAAAVAAVPPLVLLASTHLTVVLIRSTRTTTTPPQTEAPPPALPAGGTAPETPTPSPAPEPDDPSPQHEDEDDVEPTAPAMHEAHESAPTVVDAGRRERAARLRAEAEGVTLCGACQGASGAAAGGGLVEQADRPRTRCAPLDRGPLASPTTPVQARGRRV